MFNGVSTVQGADVEPQRLSRMTAEAVGGPGLTAQQSVEQGSGQRIGREHRRQWQHGLLVQTGFRLPTGASTSLKFNGFGRSRRPAMRTAAPVPEPLQKIGRASCRERVAISVVRGPLR